jgi:hypothetical protein
MTTHAAHGFESLGRTDESGFDRLPEMPLLGFFTGTVLSLAIWGAVVLIVYNVAP